MPPKRGLLGQALRALGADGAEGRRWGRCAAKRQPRFGVSNCFAQCLKRAHCPGFSDEDALNRACAGNVGVQSSVVCGKNKRQPSNYDYATASVRRLPTMIVTPVEFCQATELGLGPSFLDREA